VRGVVLALLLAVGCGGGLGAARSDFEAGHYGEARERLEKLEPESKRWSASERARYALYRGLVHHALGDRPRAATWLREAKRLEDARPNTLSADDQTRLGLALEALGPDDVAAE